MSDKTVKDLLEQGFWKTAIYRGVLKLGVAAVVLLTLLGLIWNGTEIFGMAWWRKGSLGVFVGGFVWGAALWLLAKSPMLVRELLNWGLALAMIIGGGIFLFVKFDWASALTILLAVLAYLFVLIIRENKST